MARHLPYPQLRAISAVLVLLLLAGCATAQPESSESMAGTTTKDPSPAISVQLADIDPGAETARAYPLPEVLTRTARRPDPESLKFPVETATLENGLQIVVVENHRAPIVTHMVWYRAGAADEPPGKSGIAHLLEHMMFKGTKTRPGSDFSRIVARNGGRDNAFTSADYTAYFQTIARDRLELVMGMEADRMANLFMDPEAFLTERQVVIEERLSRTDNEPAALLRERIDAALWMTHPYKNPVIGWEHELAALSRADAEAFYDRWYAPENAIVVIAGDVALAEVMPLAKRTYGALPPRDAPPRTRQAASAPPATVRVEMAHAEVRAPQFTRTFIAPSYSTQENGVAYDLEVAAEIFGGGNVGWLYRRLVVDRGLAVSAGAWYQATAVDDGQLIIYARPRPEVPIATLEAALDEEIAAFLEKGIDDATLERSKTRILTQAVFAMESPMGAANVFGRALATGQTVRDVQVWPDRIVAVTPDDALNALRGVLSDAPSATGILIPASGSTPVDGAIEAAASPGPADLVTHDR